MRLDALAPADLPAVSELLRTTLDLRRLPGPSEPWLYRLHVPGSYDMPTQSTQPPEHDG